MKEIKALGYSHYIKIKKASLGQILLTKEFESVSDGLGGKHKIKNLVEFRNKVVHHIIPNLEGEWVLSLTGLGLMVKTERLVGKIVR